MLRVFALTRGRWQRRTVSSEHVALALPIPGLEDLRMGRTGRFWLIGISKMQQSCGCVRPFSTWWMRCQVRNYGNLTRGFGRRSFESHRDQGRVHDSMKRTQWNARDDPLHGLAAAILLGIGASVSFWLRGVGDGNGRVFASGTHDSEYDQEYSRSEAVCGVSKYAANKPSEDRVHIERLDNGGWWFAVFDGHGGWQCSEYAHRNLHKTVQIELAHHLGETLESSQHGEISPEVIVRAMKSAFERTDRQYMTKVFGAFEIGFGRETRAGSCAIGVIILDGVMYVANAGDCRAVLGINKKVYENSRDKIGTASSRALRDMVDPGPIDKVRSSELDTEMELAALQDSIGGEVDPEAQKRLREKLLTKIFNEKRKREGKLKEDEAKSANADKSSENENRNPLVKAVTYLTGGSSGSRSSENAFVALPMSFDHNCKLAREREKLEREHPGEKDVVICKTHDSCYVKGKLQPTRGFGDFYLKYSEFMREAHQDGAAGKYVPPPYTPPYIYATPEVQFRKLDKELDEFLVIATDGLWDLVSSQDVIDIAGKNLRGKGGSPAQASEALVAEAIRRAAEKHNMSVEKLKSLRPGPKRRSKHDDISVIVIDLSKLLDMYYWG